jgi:CBS domain-containing protein
MKVFDLMTTNVASVRSDASLADAARRMWDCDCGALPVLDESEAVIGMITDRDICMASWSNDRAPSVLRVADAMSRELADASPDDSLAYAEGLMRSKQIRRIPVVDPNHRLLGILSLADIVLQGSSSGGRAGGEVAPDQITLTLAQICRRPIASVVGF